MSKLTNAEKDKLDNTCGNLRVTKLGTHVKTLEDFVNEGVLDTRANTVVEAINELYGMIVNKDCEGITIPPPGFFTLFGNDADGKLYCYYNDQDNPPLFEHIETPGELEGTLYLYIADPQGDNHFRMEVGHYIAVRHLNDYYTKTQCDAKYPVTVEKKSTATSGYAATYIVKQNGSQVGTKIDIPKDFFLKGGSVKTCTTANVPVQGYAVGDKYLDMEINVEDGGATTKHMYILLRDLAPTYSADESTLTLSNQNVFSVKDLGISSAKLANSAVTTDKISGSAVTNAKVSSINVSKIIDSNAHSNIGSSANANQGAINTAIDTKISELATKEEVDEIIAGDIDLTGYLKDAAGTVKANNLTDAIKKDTFHDATLIGDTAFDLDTLNTATSQGKYRCTYDNIGNLSNCPFSTANHLLLLVYNNDGTKTVQIAYKVGGDVSAYWRIYNTSWSQWRKIMSSSEISANSDLDDYKSGGFYFCPLNDTATTVQNLPVAGKAFFLIVETLGDEGSYTKQTLTHYNSNNTYIRRRSGSSWTTWEKLANISDVPTQVSQLTNDAAYTTATGHNHDGSYIKNENGAVTATNLGSNAVETAKINNSAVTMAKLAAEVQKDGFMNSTTIGDTAFDLDTLNTATSQGKYYCAYNKISNLSNAPYSSGHNMLLFVLNNESSKIVQIAFEIYDSYTVGRIYYRLSNGGWTSWQRFAAASEIPTKTSDLTNDGDGDYVFVKTNDNRLSNARTPTSHTHGFIRNDGTIIDAQGTVQKTKNVVTDADGNITTIDRASQSLGLSVSSPFSAATARYIIKNGWILIFWADLQCSSTTSSYVKIADLPVTAPYIIYESRVFDNDGIMIRVNGTKLEGRCYTTGKRYFGSITFPLDDTS